MPKKVRVVSVKRTEIVLEGEYPERVAREQFEKIIGPNTCAKLFYEFSGQETRLRFYPCRTYYVPEDESVSKRMKKKVPRCQIQLIIAGILPPKPDLLSDVWLPAKRTARDNNDDMKWVVMYAPKVIRDEDSGEQMTLAGFIIECESPDEERGCPDDFVEETLVRAARVVAENIRTIVEERNDPQLKSMQVFLDDISASMAEEIDKYLLD